MELHPAVEHGLPQARTLALWVGFCAKESGVEDPAEGQGARVAHGPRGSDEVADPASDELVGKARQVRRDPSRMAGIYHEQWREPLDHREMTTLEKAVREQ